ncbi:MAG: hypothetical protein IT538_06705, partial [Variibacter sp.]|nr:hypothetical protein [Variibacter sp.]
MKAFAQTTGIAPGWLRRGGVGGQLAVVVGFLGVAAVLPFVLDAYWQRLLVFMFVNIGLASAWNVIGGFAGYPSFGHGVFFGIGAYTAAILMLRGGVGLPVAIVGGGIVAG